MGLLDAVPFVGAGLDYLAGQANAKAARKAFNNRYQNTVMDMKKAGLNPALAYGQGGGNPQTHDLPMVGNDLAAGTAAISSARQARATAEKTMAETDLLKAQTKDLIENLRLKNANLSTDTSLKTAQIGYTGAQTEASGAQAFKSRMEGNYQQEKNKMLAETRDSDVRAQIARNAADLFAPTTAAARQRGLELENTLKNLSVAEARAMANYYSGAGKYEPYANAITRFIQGLFPRINIQGDKTFNYPRR